MTVESTNLLLANLVSLTRLTVSGFASYGTSQSIYVEPLTVLAGANSSGKSSAIKPLLLLKQTLDASIDPGALSIYGPNVRFTRLDQMFTRVLGGNPVDEFEIHLEMNSGYVALEFYRNSESSLGIKKVTYEIRPWRRSEPKVKLALSPGMSSDEIERQLPEPYRLIAEDRAKDVEEDFSRYLDRKGVEDLKRNPRSWIARRQRCFLEAAATTFFGWNYYSVSPAYHPPCNFAQTLKKVIHVPAFRRRVSRNHPIAEVGTDFPGTFEDYTAAVVAKWKADGDERLENLKDSLRQLELTSDVSTEKLSDAEVELRVARPSRGMSERKAEMVSLADVGVGVSYILPVLVALEVAEPAQIVYIEQPESHLHPKAAYGLAQALAKAAKRGVRVIVETQSSLLLLHIQTLVARGELPPESVGLHWFSLDEEGFTKIDLAETDEHGRTGEWPEDFADTELKANSAFLRAVREH